MASDVPPWWKRAVVYQIYPRSFADSNGDGVGDLRGIEAHLDHVADLGVDALWLSPFYESPMRDYGYDVSDHCAVDPIFGSLHDIDAVIAGAHERDLRIIVDFVPNHVSSDHPWFVEARSGRDSPKRDWFIWADPRPDGGPPTNWTATFTEGSTWELDEPSGQYYLHLFLPEQPDLNWANPEVEAAMHEVLRFWLDRGVDGFRMDVLNGIGKDPAARDVPEAVVGQPHVGLTHHETVHPLIRRIRETVDAAGGSFIVGEIVTGDLTIQSAYQGDGDGIHCAVNFASVWAPWERDAWRDLIEGMEAAYPHAGPRWPSWVLSNHDVVRVRSRFGGDEAKARAAAVLLLTLRGTPFVYQGEELGLEDADVPPDRVVDPGGRDGCRAPIPWTESGGHGWTDPWLPYPPDAARLSVEAQLVDPTSVLALFRHLLTVRGVHPALQTGALDVLAAPTDVLSYRRSTGEGENFVVHVNFGSRPSRIEAAGTVVVASDRAGEGGDFDGVLGPGAAVIVAS